MLPWAGIWMKPGLLGKRPSRVFHGTSWRDCVVAMRATVPVPSSTSPEPSPSTGAGYLASPRRGCGTISRWRGKAPATWSARSRRQILVVEQDGTVLGHIAYNRYRRGLDPAFAVVADISVTPNHRGRGVGRALLAAFEARETRVGVTSLFATIWPRNTASQSLFRAAGYSDAGHVEDGLPADVVRVRKSRDWTWRDTRLSLTRTAIAFSPLYAWAAFGFMA